MTTKIHPPFALATALALALGSIVVCSAQQAATANGASPWLTAFVTKATNDNQNEIELAKVAEAKASNPDVMAFAARLEQDHRANAADIQALAQTKNVTVPTAVPAATTTIATSLNALTGAAFDRAYVNEMVLDHRRDVVEFAAEQQQAEPDVKSLIDKMLPMAQTHLALAEDLQRRLGKS